jgi:hypothetical protein
MRRGCVLLLPIFAQCQSEVQAYRHSALVLFGEPVVGSNAGYTADELWLPVEGVRCILLVPPGTVPSADAEWRAHAEFSTAPDLDGAELVRLPRALAERVVAFAKLAARDEREELALADALIEAGVASRTPLDRWLSDMLRNSSPDDSRPLGR